MIARSAVLSAPISTCAKVLGWLRAAAAVFLACVCMVTPGAFFPAVTADTFAERFGPARSASATSARSSAVSWPGS